jgi:hypothetical protein
MVRSQGGSGSGESVTDCLVQYTLVRTPADQYFAEETYDAFVDALTVD